MFKDLFSNRLFIGALAIFIFCVGGSLLYMQHVTQKGEKELAETQSRVKQWNEKQKPITAEVPEGDTSQGGHWHGDEWHADPHETEQPPTAQVNEPVKLAKDPVYEEYPYGPPDSPLSPEQRVEQAWNNREFGELDGHAVPLTPIPTLLRIYFQSDDEYYRATNRKHALDVAHNKLMHEIFERQNAELEKRMAGNNQ